MSIGNAKIEGSCPGCGAVIHFTLEDVSEQRTVRCDGCSKDIELVDDKGSSKKAIADVDDAINSISKTIKIEF